MLVLVLQDVKCVKKIKDCEPAEAAQEPLICIDDPKDSRLSAINTTGKRAKLLSDDTNSICFIIFFHIDRVCFIRRITDAEFISINDNRV